MLSRITRRSRFLYSRSSRLSWIVSDDEKMKENRLITTSSAAALKTMALSPSVSGFALTFLKVSPVITCQALWAAPYPTITIL